MKNSSLHRFIASSLSLMCVFACGINPDLKDIKISEAPSVSVEPTDINLTDEELEKLESIRPGFEALVADYSLDAQSKGLTQNTSGYGEGLYEKARAYLEKEIGEGYEKYLITGTFSQSDLCDPNSRAVSPSMSYVKLTYHGENNLPFAAGMYYFNVVGKYVKMPWGSWAWGSTSMTTLDGDVIGGAELSYVKYSDSVTSTIEVNNCAQDSNGNGAIDSTEWVTSLANYSSSITWGFFPKIKGVTIRYKAQHPMLRCAAHGNGAGLPGGDVDWTRGYYNSGTMSGDV